MVIVDRKEAIELGLSRYFTGKRCRNGHIAERYISNHICLECNKAGRIKYAWHKINPEKAALSRAKWRSANKLRCASYDALWAKMNADRMAVNSAKWRASNRGKILAYSAQYQKANLDKHCKRQAKYRAAKRMATPLWVNEFVIQEAYELAQLRTKATGVNHHVDHIVPLKSKLVCGLHCEINLQVITGNRNQSKGNRWWPDMPC